MPRGYRLFFVAALGWLSLTALDQQEHGQGREAERRAENQKAESPTPLAPQTGNADEGQNAQQQCIGKDGRKADCTAISVQASVDQARDADWQADAAVAGGVIGFLTLVAAGFAAVWAWSAAHHTKRSANIARDAQRAWISLKMKPKLVTFSGEDGLYFMIDFVAENVGQTTATHVDFECEAFFQGQFDDFDALLERIEKQVENWKSDYDMIGGSNLLPRDNDIHSFWNSRQPPILQWWKGTIFGIDVSQPIFLAAVFYRTVYDPAQVQFSWRTWRLSAIDSDGKPSTFVPRTNQAMSAEHLHVEPLRTSMMHEEYPANDGKRYRKQSPTHWCVCYIMPQFSHRLLRHVRADHQGGDEAGLGSRPLPNCMAGRTKEITLKPAQNCQK